VFVVELAGVQAVVKLAEEFVEQVSLGLVVPVSGGAAGVEVAASPRGAAQRGQWPNVASRGLGLPGPLKQVLTFPIRPPPKQNDACQKSLDSSTPRRMSLMPSARSLTAAKPTTNEIATASTGSSQ
jgi:hypothetical protein